MLRQLMFHRFTTSINRRVYLNALFELHVEQAVERLMAIKLRLFVGVGQSFVLLVHFFFFLNTIKYFPHFTQCSYLNVDLETAIKSTG